MKAGFGKVCVNPPLVAAALALAVSTGSALTAYERLKASPKPHFKAGHTLLPLTRWGWGLACDANVEFTVNWGYALEFGEANSNAVSRLADTNSVEFRLCALTVSNPQRYPLSVLAFRPLSFGTLEPLPEATWCRDGTNAFANVPLWKLWSPEAPDQVFEESAGITVGLLEQVQKKAPIAIILNGGEYGLSVYGHSGLYWSKDPNVLKAKGDREWYDYLSERKAHQELIITQAIRKYCPKRKLYLWYHYAGVPTWSAWEWSTDYKWMRDVSDLPDQSLYYMHHNTGWTGSDDMLTHAMDAAAQCLEYGDRFSYNWLCSGWQEGKFSDHERYMGFLKCLYTSGMLGGVAGYFSYPKPGFTEDLGPEIPHWLRQMMVLAHAHALFSHLEDFIRKGDLLPGPDKHRRSKNLPAYEFPSGHQDTRVLVRKHRKRQEWLITAWAADGVEREVTVSIPELGMVTLKARPCGSVYTAIAEEKTAHEPPLPKLVLQDPDGMCPTTRR